ncbi:MAG: serpin family protein [Bacteroidetes bacterium]|nr:serpin family protein [Bacteroidota bacterium]
MNKLPIILILSLSLGYSSCDKDNTDPVQDLTPKTIELTAKATETISGSNEFGVDLFIKAAADENGNIMLSPLSASTALTMLLNGCGANTYDQIKNMLKYRGSMTIGEVNAAYKSLVSQLLEADPKVKLALANAVFYRKSFVVKPSFLGTMTNDFGAKTEGLDFALPSALQTINKWASDNTYGKIPKVLDEISPEIVMFLMNALYFKGSWSYQFDKTLTAEKPFYLSGGNSVNVSTMTGEVGAKVVNGDSFKAIELTYGRTNFSMTIIVPGESFSTFRSSFNAAAWKSLTSSLDGMNSFGKTIVFMPKFKFSYEKLLNSQLKSMGMTDAFDDNLANLSGISDARLYVDFVKQNTFVEINEEGTEAAAVTTIGIGLTSAGPQQTPTFIIDKPFIFAIRERTTNTLLFIGQVVNPLN